MRKQYLFIYLVLVGGRALLNRSWPFRQAANGLGPSPPATDSDLPAMLLWLLAGIVIAAIAAAAIFIIRRRMIHPPRKSS